MHPLKDWVDRCSITASFSRVTDGPELDVIVPVTTPLFTTASTELLRQAPDLQKWYDRVEYNPVQNAFYVVRKGWLFWPGVAAWRLSQGLGWLWWLPKLLAYRTRLVVGLGWDRGDQLTWKALVRGKYAGS